MSGKGENNQIQDSDIDGLFDKEEEKYGTDPFNRDTDSDNLGDYQEIKVYGTDPLDPDTDGDGINDGDEVKMGRNPKGAGMLKDLFIPHEGNDYKPHALHPKRLVFHAVGLIAIKIVLVVFLLAFPIQAWLTPDILNEQSKKIVELTNNIRAGLNIHLLTENSVLQQAALNKVRDMLIDQYFAHISPDNKDLKYFLTQQNYKYKFAGENLALGFSKAEDVVEAWTKSPTHYANLVDTDFTEIGVAMASGVYRDYETSLVAQFFGTPKQPFINLQDPEESTLGTNENIREENVEPEESKVLAKKEVKEPLTAPELTSPENKLLTKDNVINLKIFAPQAEMVAILDNGIELSRHKVYDSFIILDVSLAEGEHNIVIKSIRGEEEALSREYSITVDNTAPIIDQDRTAITANRPTGQDDLIVKAVAYLSSDTVKADIIFSGHNIELTRDYTEDGKWIGNKVISGDESLKALEPVVLASLRAVDEAGNITSEDINWKNIAPNRTTALNQYLFLKNSPSENIKPLFDISFFYYKIVLGLAVLALILNLFIKIRRQHVHIILSSLVFIILLSFLIVL